MRQLSRHLDSGALDPRSIVAIMGKTEGNGCVNDFTREYATSALATFLGARLELTPHEVEQRIAFVMSGGTEGVLSPHITVFVRTSAQAPAAAKRLAIGIAATREFLPEELGRTAQIASWLAAAGSSSMAPFRAWTCRIWSAGTAASRGRCIRGRSFEKVG